MPLREKWKMSGRAQKILDEARKGKDFARLAKKYSQDEATAKKGGELGFFSSKQMDPDFSAAAFAMEPGEISDLVRTPHGFHIIKSEEITEARTAPIEEVKVKSRRISSHRTPRIWPLNRRETSVTWPTPERI